ncbi:MAG: class I SAM-dependent methyltransferase [Verrucomicrobia bacterium]|nr:class I SAM-dependent methyltransferase [Verrucomicrobiota bacterium]
MVTKELINQKHMSMASKESEDIKEYWNQRALAANKSPTATTDDVFLRELEIKTFVKKIGEMNLKEDSVVVDVGCGDGYSTLRIAAMFPCLKFVGIDYSDEMINTARRRLAEAAIAENQIVEFQVGDATTLSDIVPTNSANVVMTDRCLINLASPEAQYDAIEQISRILCKNGCYLAIENFIEGQNELNRTRAAIGLNEIPVRWHNLFFHEDEFLTRAKSYFKRVEIDNFSSAYYYATRVIYSKECQLNGTKPDYHHPIHQLAVDLPSIGSCSPIKLAVLVK